MFTKFIDMLKKLQFLLCKNIALIKFVLRKNRRKDLNKRPKNCNKMS